MRYDLDPTNPTKVGKVVRHFVTLFLRDFGAVS